SCNLGDFSNLNQTWSKSTSLTMNNYNPYPELTDKKNCYGNNDAQTTKNSKESYCDGYSLLGGNKPFPDIFNYQLGMVNTGNMATLGMPTKPSKEHFDNACCGNPYAKLKQTWDKQKKFTL